MRLATALIPLLIAAPASAATWYDGERMAYLENAPEPGLVFMFQMHDMFEPTRCEIPAWPLDRKWTRLECANGMSFQFAIENESTLTLDGVYFYRD